MQEDTGRRSLETRNDGFNSKDYSPSPALGVAAGRLERTVKPDVQTSASDQPDTNACDVKPTSNGIKRQQSPKFTLKDGVDVLSPPASPPRSLPPPQKLPDDRHLSLQDWRPSEISPEDFTKLEDNFIKLGDGEGTCPAIVISWRSFRKCLYAMMTHRKYEASQQLTERELERIKDKKAALHGEWNEQVAELRKIHSFGQHVPSLCQQADTKPVDAKQVSAKMDEIQGKLDALHDEASNFNADLKKLYEYLGYVCEEVVLSLDDAFVKLGILQHPDHFDKPGPVKITAPLLESDRDPEEIPENNWNDENEPPGIWHDCIRSETVEFPEDTWNNTLDDYPDLDPDRIVIEGYKEKKQQFLEVKDDFESRRADFYLQRETYIAANQHRANSIQLEDEFGAEWVRRGQEMTKRYVEAEKAFDVACERYTKVQERRQAAEEPDDTSHPMLPPPEERTENYGAMLPERQRKRILSWMEIEFESPLSSGRESAAPRTDSLRSLTFKAVGSKRRKIDAYNLQVGREN
ncbi:hypothetical protein BS50DRAFT_616153 [Corynespora cassiicola Philippines]|uniref:Uncharacterized protein n=1 Tax=Corynespora cassiicola Philippines TaxID=1448308 RepID=A0A2T2PD07_CORCC|nr:hypothetical protein BS50DRAFT_616153 [Corynespora cassiicola Philippines]